ncbi:MAG: HD-GYP domain-containing protein [Armatimonadetes bacterium]|nr:HD-GYP domain-containing protein [Armatimonadota bacterium]
MDNHTFVVAAFALAGVVCVVSLYVSLLWLPRKMESAYQCALRTLATAVETKDSRTLGHAERVAEMVAAIGRELGLSKDQIKWARYGALLRDIGKAAVPHRILNKQGPLSPGELRVVHSHVREGAEIVDQIPFLQKLRPIILHHHERWDGTGYPDGLAGEDIPLASRIIGLVDDYEAIISERPYHLPMSEDAARKLIVDGAGSKYDARVVRAFVSVADTVRLRAPVEETTEARVSSAVPA